MGRNSSPSASKSSRRTLSMICFGGGALFGTLLAFYLWYLYGQLTTVFTQEPQFIPTRIYSDVIRIGSNQSRLSIEKRLKALGYRPKLSDNLIQFVLHPVDYPTYLLPENHPTLDLGDTEIHLLFDGSQPTSRLKSIDAKGQTLTEIFLEPELVATLSQSGNPKQEIRTFLKFDQIPALVWKAIIAIEDQHFLEHKGLDPRGIARAIWVNLKTLSLAQGGSTITQQLVKNLMARRTKNIFRKVNELFLAVLLEAKFEKEKILERYLNEVYLGQVGSLEVHGVAEGAEHFFAKKLDDLNLAEIALLAGVIRGPGYYSPYRYWDRAIERQKLVLKKMVETGQIAEGEAKAALQLPIRLAPPQTSSNRAPFFTDYVKAELIKQLKDRMSETEMIQAGFRIYTTLDSELNAFAQAAVSAGINQLEIRHRLKPAPAKDKPDTKNTKDTKPPSQKLEGALACVDHTNGYIRALVGGRNYAQSNFNRILNMKRQIGSTFKPLVYLTAIARGEDSQGVPYGPGHPAEDAPWTLIYDNGRQTWAPKNYEKGYMGWISYRKALAHSVNTIASKLGYEIGIASVVQTARTLGIESQLPLVPSLALGVAELSPIELLRVYSNFANHGVQEDLTVIRGIVQSTGSGFSRPVQQSHAVFEASNIDLLVDMLQTVFIDGTASSAKNLGFTRPAAGKTGTTSNHKDAWFAGFTPQLTTVVWVGLDEYIEGKSTPVHLTGGGSALPIWTSFMNSALDSVVPTPFPVSPGLTEVVIDTHTGKAAKSDCPKTQTVSEKFLQNHTPKDQTCEPQWPPPTPQTIRD